MAEFSVEPLPPFRLDLTCWALRRRPANIVDRWDGETYRRVLVIRGRPREIAVREAGRVLNVSTGRGKLTAEARAEVRAALKRLLGLEIDLSKFYEVAARHRRLNELADHFRGVKPPRFLTVFEALVNGITCQQLSLSAGIAVLNRLVQLCGPQIGGSYGFPAPDDVRDLRMEDLRRLGYSSNKCRALLELARSARQIQTGELAELDNASVLSRLLALRGVGRWTAEYALLRGLGRTEVFPAGDVGARNGVERWLGKTAPLDDEALQRVLARWRGYSGLVYFHLLLRGLEEAGCIDAAR